MIEIILFTLIALAFSLTFWGKSIIGIGLALSLPFAIFKIVANRDVIFTKQNISNFLSSKEVILMALMFLLWLIAASQGLDTSKSYKETMEIFGLAVGGGTLFLALQNCRLSLDHFFIIASAGASIAGLSILVGVFFDSGLEWSTSYGAVLALIFPMAFHLAITKKSYKYLFWAMVFIIIAAIVASDSRTAWVTLGFLFLLTFLITPWRRVASRYRKAGTYIVIIPIAVFVGLQSYYHHLGNDHYERRTTEIISERPASGRFVMWDQAIDHIKEHWLFGVGIKNAHLLNIEKREGEHVRHLHNAILEIQLETGVFGLLLFSITILVFVGRFIRAYVRSGDDILKLQSIAIFLSCISFGISAMSLTSIFYTWWFLYLVVLLVLLKTAELRLKEGISIKKR